MIYRPGKGTFLHFSTFTLSRTFNITSGQYIRDEEWVTFELVKLLRSSFWPQIQPQEVAKITIYAPLASARRRSVESYFLHISKLQHCEAGRAAPVLTCLHFPWKPSVPIFFFKEADQTLIPGSERIILLSIWKSNTRPSGRNAIALTTTLPQ